MRIFAILAGLLLSAPVLAQSTSTTVTSQPQAQPPPPPPSSTTVTTSSSPAPAPQQPSTQVVVNPNDPKPATTDTTHVRVSEDTHVETVHGPTRSAGAIVATDAVYGGVAGAVVGGGIALINEGNNWQRDLMVGGGIGILVGTAFGIYEAVSQPSGTTVVTHAAADRDPAASSVPAGLSASVFSGKF